MFYDTLTLVVAAAAGATLLTLLAMMLLAREAMHQGVLRQMTRTMVQGGPQSPRAGRRVQSWLIHSIQRLGFLLQQSSLFSLRDLAELERAARAAGFSPQTAVPALIGGKCVLIFACPSLAYLLAVSQDFSSNWRMAAIFAGALLGMFGPNSVLRYARNVRVTALRLGLTDALDLLVVCAEAGLGLESAIDRVAAEMKVSNPAVANEFATLAQDLRLTSDRAAALMRMGERTGLDSFQRLTVTLAQGLRYGTPLGQALRVLATEMRNDRLLRLEEKAARLPTLLMLPLGLFILPCLFIVVIGPAALRFMDTLAQ